MTVIADYAAVYETHFRLRRGRGLRRLAAHIVWLGLFVVRPGLALDIWREARG